MPEVDEYGIPIRKAASVEVDEYGIPVKKKISDTTLTDSASGFYPSTPLPEPKIKFNQLIKNLEKLNQGRTDIKDFADPRLNKLWQQTHKGPAPKDFIEKGISKTFDFLGDHIPDRIKNAWEQGKLQGEMANLIPVMSSPGANAEEIANQIASYTRLSEQIPQSPEAKKLNENGVLWAFKNPVEGSKALGEVIISSLAGQSKAAERTTPAAVATGAAMGSVVPWAGTLAGAVSGFTAGQILAGLNVESSSTFLQVIKDAGFPLNDEDKLAKAFSDKKLVDKARDLGIKRGLPIAIFDLMTAGIGGRLATSTLNKVAKPFAVAGVEALGGSSGELAAQVVSGQKIDPNAIALEGIAELGSGAPALLSETGGNVIERKKTSSSNANIIKQVAADKETGVKEAKENLDRNLKDGLISPEEHAEGTEFVDKVVAVDEKIPTKVEGENREKSIELVSEKEQAIAELKALAEEKKKTDDAYHEPIEGKIERREEKVKKIDKELKELAVKPKEEPIVEIKEEPTDAIQVGEPEALPLEEPPGDSREVVEGVSESRPEVVAEESISQAIPESTEEKIVAENQNIDLAIEGSQTAGEFEGKTTDELLEDKKLLADNPVKYFEKIKDDFFEQLKGNISPEDRGILEDLYSQYDAIHRDLLGITDEQVNSASKDLFGKDYNGLSAAEKDNALYEASGRKDLVPEKEDINSVIAKAESDLETLKKVEDKTKKYEASIKRLTDAKNDKQITEKEFNAFKERFDEVLSKSAPKEKVAEISEEVETPVEDIVAEEVITETPQGELKAGDRVTFKNNVTKDPDFGEVTEVKANGDYVVRRDDGGVNYFKPEDLTKTEEPVSQESTQDRKKNKVSERIQVARTAPTSSPKKLNKIIGDLAKALKATVIYAKSRRRNSAGSYNPTNALTNLVHAGDIDTAAHEMGHFLDDSFNLLGTKPAGVDAQLKWFADRGGSNPPAGMKGKAAQTYREREGLAEFIRAYIANPAEAKIASPELFEHFEKTISAEALKAIKDFSKDYIDFANAPAGDQILANILETPELKDKPSVVEWLMDRSNDKDNFAIGWYDDLKSHIATSLHAADKAFKYAKNLKGVGTLLPEKNFETIARLFAGSNGKMNRVFESGMVNNKNFVLKAEGGHFARDEEGRTVYTDKDGNSLGTPMTVNWLLESLDATSEETLKQEFTDVIKYTVAQRTIEYSKKFGRSSALSGIGGGVKTDVSVAAEHLRDFEEMKKANPEKAGRIEEAARRYRQYADAGLKYALDKGRLSQEQYDAIKDGNEYYVSLARVNEVSPEQEPLAFVNQFAKGGLGSVKQVLHKAKGGTGLIQNPYISLLKNTSDLIIESDRNQVLQNFVEVLTEDRNMGEGEVKALSEIGRQVQEGTKNTMTVFVDGKPQKWQFQQDVYSALKALQADKDSALGNFVQTYLGPKVLRWTVTHFPAFAAKNLIRDTQQRFIQSRSNGGFRDLIHSKSDRELFDIYGASQAGYHLSSRESYYDRMAQATKELTDKGGIILDARKLGADFILEGDKLLSAGDLKGFGKSYVKFLESSENVNRIAEVKSAYRQAKKQGLDDYNAGLYAAYQGRDLLDFAVAGHTIRQINKYVPFTNAGVQGLRRTITGIKERPVAFAAKMALYSVLPQVLVHAWNIYNGDEEEYEELPFYQRDLFYNFKTPLTGDKWISIPKPFDLGLVSSGIDRGISLARGHKGAFGKFGRSLYTVISPVDESTMIPVLKPLVEIIANKDLYRDQSIVPAWEENLMLSKRKGTKYASNLGKMLSDGFGLVGADADPRYIDHALKGFASYYGDFGMRLSNTGSETGKKLGVEQTGLMRERPIANAKDVMETYDLAEKLGEERSKGITALKDAVGTFYDLTKEDDREKQAKKIYEIAKKEKVKLEQQLKEQEIVDNYKETHEFIVSPNRAELIREAKTPEAKEKLKEKFLESDAGTYLKEQRKKKPALVEP